MKLPVRMFNWLIIFYVIAILILSLAPTNSNSKVNLSSTSILSIHSDYLLHALLFFPWMVLTHLRWKEKGLWFYMKALGVGLLLAVLSEGVQYVLPYRSFNVVDLAANSLGIVVGALITGWGRSRKVVSSE